MSSNYAQAVDNIDTYMKTVASFPLLTSDDEIALYKRIHGADASDAETALTSLIQSNLRLVVKIAHDFKQYNYPFADLVAEGNAGLITAAHRFNPDKGAKFSCYAAWWIKQAMRKALSDKTRLIRLPVEQAHRQTILDYATQNWITRTGTEPTEAELATECDMPIERVHDTLLLPTHVVSIDNTSDDGESGSTFHQLIQDSRDIDASFVREQRLDSLDTLLASLSDLRRFIITHLYGIGVPELSRCVIAQETGLSIDTLDNLITQIHAQLRNSLSTLLESEAYD